MLTVGQRGMHSFLVHSRNKRWDGHYYSFYPLPGDIVDVTPAKQLPTRDIVVNMDGGVGGSWREVSLPENNQEPFIPSFHD